MTTNFCFEFYGNFLIRTYCKSKLTMKQSQKRSVGEKPTYCLKVTRFISERAVKDRKVMLCRLSQIQM